MQQPPPYKRKGVYKYKCPCSDKAVYIGQTTRSYAKKNGLSNKKLCKTNNGTIRESADTITALSNPTLKTLKAFKTCKEKGKTNWHVKCWKYDGMDANSARDCIKTWGAYIKD